MKICGRGLACSPDASDFEIESDIIEASYTLSETWRRRPIDAKRLRDVCAGAWRLVWTSNEAFRGANAIDGGPLKAVYESIGDDVVHTAFASRAPLYGVVLPWLVGLCLLFAYALRPGLIISACTVYAITQFASKMVPNGVFASRSVGFKIDDEGKMTSKLERGVCFFVATSASFDVSSKNPMPSFCSAFDNSNGAKDPLKVGFLFGWRMVVRPFLAFHLLHEERTRAELILYADEDLRVVQGGDVAKDGTEQKGISIWVRAY